MTASGIPEIFDALAEFGLEKETEKVLSYEDYRDIPEGAQPKYELTLTNREAKLMFQRMVRDWRITMIL